MSDRKYHLHNGQKGAALAVRITPRASSNQITEILHDGTIRIRLVATSGEEMNAALKSYLAQVLGVSESSVEIVAGQSGRDKLVSVLNLDSETAHQKVLSHLA
ncbi:MAG TPA: hypothetical protein DEH25_09455 [Chloroflexi bacterium]|nr:hypothetical protein [Chloroflexota bacterium]HBY06796.1 hypothetical protein [Chloroflexota bacterium]